MKNKPIRVMYFVAEYTRFAGAQKSLLALLQHLPGGVEPVVVFTAEGRCVDMYREAGLKVSIVKTPEELNVFGKQLLHRSLAAKLLIFLRSVLPYNRKLRAFMKEADVDLVHFNTPRALLIGFLAPKLLGKPVVLHVRGHLEVIGRLAIYLSGWLSDRLLLVSGRLQKELPPAFHNKCVAVLDLYESADAAQGEAASLPAEATGKTVVLVPSSLVPFKGYHHLLQAIRIVNDSPAHAGRVFFLGLGETPDDNYAAFIREMQRRLGIKNFLHLGWQKNPFPFYRASDVVVLPSVEKETFSMNGEEVEVIGNEGLPRTILEAMYFGKPVIGSDIAGLPDLIETGVNGFLVPPGKPEALAAALMTLIAEPQKRESMGQRSREKVEGFAPERIVEKVVRVYEELVAA